MSGTAEKLVSLGANLEISSGTKYLSGTLERLVQLARANGGHITIHADGLLSGTLERLASLGGNHVTFKI